MRKSFDEVLKYTEYAIKTISQKSMTEDEKEFFINETRHNFDNHINPGFLEYRKSAGSDDMAMEWMANGDTFVDLHGNTYIDCLGGFGAFNCGHRHPKVIETVTNQLAKQPLSSAELIDANRSLLARILADVTPGDLQYTFFTSSGTEAVECGLKMATLATGRHYYVAFKGDFHGKTMGSLSLTSKEHFRGPFLPLLQGVRHAPFGDLDFLKKLIDCMEFTGELPAAIIYEPIQGEGGVQIPPDDFIPGIREICDKYDIMMIADEVQAGMGRTGYLFATDYSKVTPDILCLGKSISGSVVPLSACVCTERAFRGMFPDPLLHSTTTGGNPLATAAGIAAFHVILSEDLCGKAKKSGAIFMEGLEKLHQKYPKLLTAYRGRGLMIAMEFCDGDLGYEVVFEAFNRKLLLSGSLINAKTIRIEPPLNITEEHVRKALEILDESMEIVYNKHFK
ncbi:aminotransferase class III-fold pyridoxal phosphate-dependent enzyme [Sinanaerobacter chloroacetimidivorans]|uniref:Aminotransferase class III-fold pyridoxal phosphate-dependent enzyme n=1 Tax=Sinanaerobacter chloroacetimidivorans TaxID=2818044 RepID=A0A8J7W186_9FIRM|nr:aminotransferase class III-fold pyridoxal phosphate-dependent enzyme [Sinanaerobacter chloroacetimidivorans]MBR0598949.1 aminotransferase class III-fold pyridoxal phosphate-dependent enzyme [Sinanaerobacter chloroacetimidivorans]